MLFPILKELGGLLGLKKSGSKGEYIQRLEEAFKQNTPNEPEPAAAENDSSGGSHIDKKQKTDQPAAVFIVALPPSG